MTRHTSARAAAAAAALLLATTAATVLAAPVADPAASAAPADTDQAYEQTIGKRADEILKAVGDLKDDAKTNRVREAIISQYHFLKDWHAAHDAELKALTKRPADAAKPQADAIKATLRTQHDAFVKRLSDDLTPAQVEAVKDKLTYNVVHVTYNAYQDMLPTLTEEQKSYILATLKDAREEAMDGGSSDEKHAVFGRYKGRINIYLTKQGYDMKKASKEWQERLKAAKEKRGSDAPAAPAEARHEK